MRLQIRRHYASLLRSAARLLCALSIHGDLLALGLDRDPFLCNFLLRTYGSFGALPELSSVFFASLPLPLKDRFSWNFALRSFAENGETETSLQIFRQMASEGMLPDRFISVGAVSLFEKRQALEEGRRFHACIHGSDLETDTVVGTAFLNMYSKCGSLRDAEIMFDKMSEQDAVSFNAMIASVDSFGRSEAAVWLFNQMQQQAIVPEKVTFLNLLSTCTSEEMGLCVGKRLHALCVYSGFIDESSVGTAVVSMYGKCGNVEDAQLVFSEITKRDVIAWNAMITVYAQQGHMKQALRLVEEMKCGPIMPDTVTLVSILDACAKQGLILDNHWIEMNINGSTAGSDVEVGISLMNMYSKFGNLERSLEIFNSLSNRSISSWNTIVSSFAKDRNLDMTLQLTEAMLIGGMEFNKLTYLPLLDACGSQVEVNLGSWLHVCIIESNLELDPGLNTSLMEMYGKCGRVHDACKIFECTYDRNVIAWNAMISGYIVNFHNGEALHLFQQMLNEAVLPSDITFLGVLDACTSLKAFSQGTWIHTCVLGMEHQPNAVLGTALINMYAKCGNVECAQRLFSELQEKDVVSWSAIISAYVQISDTSNALGMFKRMLAEGEIPDKVTYTSILCVFIGRDMIAQAKTMHASLVAIPSDLDEVIETSLICMYFKCGSPVDACTLFGEKNRNVASWNALMSGLTQSGDGMQAFQLFDQMQQEGLLPNSLTFVSILEACSEQNTLSKGHRIHAAMTSSVLLHDEKVRTTLLNMYANCGNIEDAEREFYMLPLQNIDSWTAIISAHAQHGHGQKALHLLNEMINEELIPNKATFASIISACSHDGIVDEVNIIFHFAIQMTSGADLFNCLIDLLARAGKLDEAEALITQMPHDPTVVSWTTLLGACRNQIDVERGERAAKKLFRLDSENPEPYVALSNIYAAAGMGVEAQMMFDRMRGVDTVEKRK